MSPIQKFSHSACYMYQVLYLIFYESTTTVERCTGRIPYVVRTRILHFSCGIYMGLIVLASLEKYLGSAMPIDIPLRFQSDKQKFWNPISGRPGTTNATCREQRICSRPVRWLTETNVVFIGERGTDWPVRPLYDLVSSLLLIRHHPSDDLVITH